MAHGPAMCEEDLLIAHTVLQIVHAEIATWMQQCESGHFDKGSTHVHSFETQLQNGFPDIAAFCADGRLDLVHLLEHPIFGYFVLTKRKLKKMIDDSVFEDPRRLSTTEVLEYNIADVHSRLSEMVRVRQQDLAILNQYDGATPAPDPATTDCSVLHGVWDDPLVGCASDVLEREMEFVWNILDG